MERYKAPKGNKFATVQKGRKQKKTIIKNRIKEIASWDTVEAVVEKNIMELLTSNNKKEKLEATKAFAEFVKPKKRESVHDFKGNIVLRIAGLDKI
jgi:hypothetical protein